MVSWVSLDTGGPVNVLLAQTLSSGWEQIPFFCDQYGTHYFFIAPYPLPIPPPEGNPVLDTKDAAMFAQLETSFPAMNQAVHDSIARSRNLPPPAPADPDSRKFWRVHCDGSLDTDQDGSPDWAEFEMAARPGPDFPWPIQINDQGTVLYPTGTWTAGIWTPLADAHENPADGDFILATAINDFGGIVGVQTWDRNILSGTKRRNGSKRGFPDSMKIITLLIFLPCLAFATKIGGFEYSDQQIADMENGLRHWKNIAEAARIHPSSKMIPDLGAGLLKTSTTSIYVVGDRLGAFEQLKEALLSIPGHAEYYRDRVLEAQARYRENKNETLDGIRYNDLLHERATFNLTVSQLPSVESVRVIGEFLSEEWIHPRMESLPKNERIGPMSLEAVLTFAKLPLASKPANTRYEHEAEGDLRA